VPEVTHPHIGREKLTAISNNSILFAMIHLLEFGNRKNLLFIYFNAMSQKRWEKQNCFLPESKNRTLLCKVCGFTGTYGAE
jgi:hypothetical protein